MKSSVFLGTVLAGTLTFATPSFATDFVSKVMVEADLSAIQNAKASQVWADLPADLEAEIADRLIHQTDQDGATISIDIDEISLANNFEAATGLDKSMLKGAVKIRGASVGTNTDYVLTVTADQALQYLPDGGAEIPEIDSAVFYEAMVDAFADNVASKMQ